MPVRRRFPAGCIPGTPYSQDPTAALVGDTCPETGEAVWHARMWWGLGGDGEQKGDGVECCAAVQMRLCLAVAPAGRLLAGCLAVCP